MEQCPSIKLNAMPKFSCLRCNAFENSLSPPPHTPLFPPSPSQNYHSKLTPSCSKSLAPLVFPKLLYHCQRIGLLHPFFYSAITLNVQRSDHKVNKSANKTETLWHACQMSLIPMQSACPEAEQTARNDFRLRTGEAERGALFQSLWTVNLLNVGLKTILSPLCYS